MKKDLDKFIAANRAEFDDQPLPDALWDKVVAGLEAHEPRQQRKGLPRNQWFRIAATLLLSGALGILIYFYGKQQGYEDYVRINPDLAASRAGYQQLVEQRKDSVMVFASQNPGLETEFEDALTYMESNYEALRKELESSPNQERTLRAMILNLQAQAEVLNQQLIILSKLNNQQNEKL